MLNLVQKHIKLKNGILVKDGVPNFKTVRPQAVDLPSTSNLVRKLLQVKADL